MFFYGKLVNEATYSTDRGQPRMPAIDQVAVNQLQPHPRNSSIYGEEDVSELVELIRDSRWVKPLVVTRNHIIISGNRRWKAACLLGWESLPVEYREFPDELAELEALLLENASRFKTTEQKVREGQAWKDVETQKARGRQTQAALSTNQKLGRETGETLCENFRTASKAKSRSVNLLASRVGLGSGRTYEKAAKVVEAIDEQTILGNLETAQTLRSMLNERSVDAAAKLLKRISLNSDCSGACLTNGLFTTSNSYEGATSDSQRSCWNCQHRGELIENHSFYCNRLGALSLLDKSADTRGAKCDLWSYRETDSDEAENKTQPTHATFTLTLPGHLQPLLQDAARIAGMSVVDWATWVLESEALTTCTESSVAAEPDKTLHQVNQCRSP